MTDPVPCLIILGALFLFSLVCLLLLHCADRFKSDKKDPTNEDYE